MSISKFAMPSPWACKSKTATKPEPEIWRILLDTLGAKPSECLFFDDRAENIEGAREAGLRAELWSSAARARNVIEEQLAG